MYSTKYGPPTYTLWFHFWHFKQLSASKMEPIDQQQAFTVEGREVEEQNVGREEDI